MLTNENNASPTIKFNNPHGPANKPKTIESTINRLTSNPESIESIQKEISSTPELKKFMDSLTSLIREEFGSMEAAVKSENFVSFIAEQAQKLAKGDNKLQDATLRLMHKMPDDVQKEIISLASTVISPKEDQRVNNAALLQAA